MRSREEELAVVAVGGATELRRSFAEVVRVRCRAAMVARDGVHGGGVKLRRCRCRRGGCVRRWWREEDGGAVVVGARTVAAGDGGGGCHGDGRW
ncbi:hypothetical protein DEO72_LG3g1492 [Vigna unguiculata]|uniref:Uncharacterized protein n=1 Tax=Vigna unguiculata TaxID=3917 RepID=A0A4D6LEC7_VIGUN|nr:hypothetical protein DEO72_LG3g1492 [Vigna unguiculata]